MKWKMNNVLLRIIISAICFLLGILCHQFELIALILFIIAYFIVGVDVYVHFIKHLSIKTVFDERFLMIIATLGAFAIGEYPEAVAVMLFYQIGEYIGDQAVDRSKEKIMSLMDLRSDIVHLLKGKDVLSVAPNTVKIGENIIVKPGETVPLDGKIIKGEGYIDTVMLTGESVPCFVKKNNQVFSGSVVMDQVLTIEVEKLLEESTVSKIMNLIENCENKKTDTEQFITRFSKVYTPIVVLLAILICVIPTVFFQSPFQKWFYRSLVFLVVSCPCALVVSVPLGFFCGIGASSRQGILMKGSESLERLTKLNTIVFDKTGTLTKGTFQVVKVVVEDGFTKQEVIQYASSAECYSNHPIAKSIQNYYGKKVKLENISNVKELGGFGVQIDYLGKEILVGNDRLMKQYQIPYHKVNEVGTIIHISVDKKYAGYFVIRDEIKEDAKRTIISLQQMGIRNIMLLSGDNEKIVKQVSENLGIHQYFSNLLPQDKVKKVEQLIKKRNSSDMVAFVGDGMNDAPVLMLSDIGISMGGIGSDAAIEASDIVIMNDQLYKIIDAIKIAKKTKRIVWQNIIFAISVKVAVLILGSMGITAIWTAVFADVGVTLLAILNALRIWYLKDE